MKIVLAGSPQISVNAFEEIIKNFDVVAIITQPDKIKGRGLKLLPTPVSILAKKYKIKTFKPIRIAEIHEELSKLNFDLFLTFAYGQFIPQNILSLGKFKPVNIHGSLLPKYRGAAPIHYAILNNDNKIGITLIEMIDKMDAGDMFFKAKENINENTTTGEAFQIIDSLAKNNIVSWINKIKNNKVIPTKQGKNFTTSPKIEKSFGNIENLNKEQAIRRIRGLNPFPGSFIILNEKRLKIFDVSYKEVHKSIKINLKDGYLYAIDFQWESKKRIILK